jgi:glycerol-3-phosphate dehydrogenase
MQRDLSTLTDRSHDLLIIGGGVHGAIAAWDAAQRGLSVALVERHDFGGATSANSLKTVHGGLRYLQQADLRRMRLSIAERSTLLRIAPHLVRPLGFLVPTSGGGKRSRTALGLALKLADAIGFDRNRGLADGWTLPGGCLVSPGRLGELFPRFERNGLTGGAIWYDAQLQDSERLTLAFLLSAAERGAVMANYVRADRLLLDDRTVRGARVSDRLSRESFDVRASMVLNAAGPWALRLLPPTRSSGRAPRPGSLALGINLVCRGRISELAVGFQSTWPAARDPVCGGGRYLFLAPWKQSTLLGTAYRPWDPADEVPHAAERDLMDLLDECNAACPGLSLCFDDVTHYHRGLVPLKAGLERGRAGALAEHGRIIDHESEDRIRGLISMIGVKYTTARYVAEKTIDRALERLGRPAVACRTASTPIYGGEGRPVPDAPLQGLTQRHGERATTLLRRFAERPGWDEPLAPGCAVLAGEVGHAVEAEMALKLADVVFRRTAMGSEGAPPREQLEAAARWMAEPLGWSDDRREAEVSEVLTHYRPLPGSPGR